MSQHDLSIANQGFPAFRSDLNDALQALGSLNSGATAPSTTYANMLWYDTANNILKIRNEDNDAWISIVTLDQTGDAIASMAIPAVSGNVNFDSDTLYVDATNNRVGIGTSSPSRKLHVVDSGSFVANFQSSGTGIYTSWQASGGTVGYIGGAAGLGGGSATDFGIRSETNMLFLTNAGSERMRIDSSGNLLVGANAQVSTEKAYIYQSGTGRVLIARSDNGSFADNCIQASVNRNTSNNTFNAFAYYNDAAAAYRFKVADSGAIATAGGIALGAATAPTSGIGVQFPATQSASSDANTLDDYEEGTWTPSYTPTSGSFSSITYDFQNGRYIKIGKMVYVQFAIRTSALSIGTASGSVLVTGFPFTENGATSRGAGFITGQDGWVTNAPMQFYVSGGTQANLEAISLGQTSYTGITASNMSTSAGLKNRIFGSIVYEVA